MVTYTLPRAKTLALALGVYLLGSHGVVAQTGSPLGPTHRHGRVSAALTQQPLGFFTIAERVAALRAKGALAHVAGSRAATQPVSTAPRIETASLAGTRLDHDSAPPRADDLGLRSSISDIKPSLVLDSLEFPVPGGELASKWEKVMARWEADKHLIEQCGTALCNKAGARKWLEIQAKASQLSGLDQLSWVNSAINRSIAYATDFQVFNEADYWASPLEVMEQAGDCEDFVIAKYIMLRSLGVVAADLKLVAIFETFSGQYHAILAIRHEGDWLFLDNKHSAIATAKDYKNTRPVASVDAINGQSMLVRTGTERMS